MQNAHRDSNADRGVRAVVRQAVKKKSYFGGVARHARELAVSRIDDAVKNEQAERAQTQAFVVKKQSRHTADDACQKCDLIRRRSAGQRCARNYRPERSEKINVR